MILTGHAWIATDNQSRAIQSAMGLISANIESLCCLTDSVTERCKQSIPVASVTVMVTTYRVSAKLVTPTRIMPTLVTRDLHLGGGRMPGAPWMRRSAQRAQDSSAERPTGP